MWWGQCTSQPLFVLGRPFRTDKVLLHHQRGVTPREILLLLGRQPVVSLVITETNRIQFCPVWEAERGVWILLVTMNSILIPVTCVSVKRGPALEDNADDDDHSAVSLDDDGVSGVGAAAAAAVSVALARSWAAAAQQVHPAIPIDRLPMCGLSGSTDSNFECRRPPLGKPFQAPPAQLSAVTRQRSKA
jgi:hypothetical protein